MIVEETFYRPPELSREPRTLPAETYNLAHVLLKRAATGCLFVPIRSMQFLAILDGEEFIFVDREGRRMIELAWQHFAPQGRGSLEEPVSYEAVYYSPAAAEIMRQIQGELHKALRDLEQKSMPGGRARVIPLNGKSP
ncbi:MAG: hypothetical protein A3E57_08935 [Candidatus Muproteobacteria bacterium RIFCSPHIGHO2_12_FULL_60_33]|uniref:Uncharacterized protein n=1 Tax=Candidatus Muproteobacteria bacterium RIFCSPLOWO2_01_FULL_60_18 TaxID=1817768 RepID=A0A1F6U3P4_9PROT|nr:MAG: hypothetical protein A3A87_08205 [Candidatus Muproteobacteria bacterium RIFCSPLOWO2_01_FULL_60_18]OGI53255.1 MAG: hypothetical protein A2W42_02080 [Candidatus Muproteobacteria bacterium RIFCSPHIGHO2_01_60_12]OGI55556.1 MAG: hypothetical protein A3E57_08935 [Candidatus Muproteobacteria bacterium RIFCSPHIGHO2_12_FULL_60_33]OGI56844.1 MAG: hypothetical protein A3D32_08595 [Candidatus Muproteobacteria bacterium RIFCSPHIGHO2_02_FULL_60_13]OGI59285.1 MAG: hypothetical protein A2809_02455 [Can